MGFYVDYSEPEFTSPNISKETALYFLDTSKITLKEYKEFLEDLEIEKWTKIIKKMRNKKMIKSFLNEFIPFLKSFF